MLLRVVDYIANPGGGVRFTAELLRALARTLDGTIELVSHADALERYRALIGNDADVAFRDVAPSNQWRTGTVLEGIPGAGLLNWVLRTRCFHLDVPASALEGCDVAWFPWLHRHRFPRRLAGRVVGTLHDVITLDFPGIVGKAQRLDERETVRCWLSSDARVVVSSNATVDRLQALFAMPRGRVTVVPLSGMHDAARAPRGALPALLAGKQFLLSPINITQHKNHEILLAGVGAWGARLPLVLTGGGTDLWRSRNPRAVHLAGCAEAAGLTPDRSVLGLGYVDDPTYYALLDAAWALVMPTLAEGGGSFPVWEALLNGVPVVCSDIPVMREMMQRVGGDVLWFDPRSPQALADTLRRLERDYPAVKARAVEQVSRLHQRSWGDVAREYADVLGPSQRSREVGG